MKTRHIVLALTAAGMLLGGGYGIYRLGVGHGVGLADASHAPAGATKGGERKVLYWHDPMVPGQRFDKPGKSPFMDMPLVPVYADEGADGGKAVSISPQVQQNLGIRTAEATMGSMSTPIEVVGNVAYNERDTALVQARSGGFVERLFVRAPLDPVRKGQALAQVYMPDWVAAQEEYLTVRRMQGPGSEGLLEGARQRMRLAGMTDDQIGAVTSTGRLQPRLTIRAPIGGVVAELDVREGMTVTAGTPLFRINGLDTVWVNGEVPEGLASQIRPGTAVEARAPALGGATLKGKVSAILPDVSTATRTFKARVELQNPGHRLVPGMFATLNFAPAAQADVLTVPTEAVIMTGERSVVMVAQGKGGFTAVDVQTGVESGGRTEIRSGLKPGQKVVVSGQFLIDSEASLKGSAARMAPVPAAQPVKASGTHRGEGTVEHIGKQEVTLSHGPVPGLGWPAMTMSFGIAPALDTTGLQVGEAIRFEFREASDGSYEVTRIEPAAGHAGHAPSPASAAAGAKR